MIEVVKNVYVGDLIDAQFGWKCRDNWGFIHCAKDPWHRQFVGYSGRGCPKDSSEYLYAIRGNAIALNIVDVDNPDFFDKEMIKMAIAFACEHEDKKLLFSCNKGESRSPSIAMLYLAITGKIPGGNDFDGVEKAFKRLYSQYNPSNGIRTHLKTNWELYTWGWGGNL